MRVFLLLALLSSDIALSAVCGKARTDISVEGLGIDFTAGPADVDCEYTKSGGKLSGQFKVKIKDLKTGIEMRDDHLQEALKSAANPHILFTLKDWEAKEGAISGDVTLNGVTKRVEWKAKLDGAKWIVFGKLDYTDFKLEQAKYKKAGVTLATVPKVVEVEVEVSI